MCGGGVSAVRGMRGMGAVRGMSGMSAVRGMGAVRAVNAMNAVRTMLSPISHISESAAMAFSLGKRHSVKSAGRIMLTACGRVRKIACMRGSRDIRQDRT